MTIKTSEEPGKNFMSKVLLYFQQKANTILFDENLNSRQTVAQNIYNIFSFGAIKFVVHLKQVVKTTHQNLHNNIGFFKKCLWIALGYVSNLLIRITNSSIAKECGCRFTFSRDEVQYIGLSAIQLILLKKQTLFKPLLLAVRSRLNRFKLTTQWDLTSTAFDTILF